MLVDRNELEAQLFGNLRSVGVDYVEAESKRHLRQPLQTDRRDVIVSTIHRFDLMPADVNVRRNVFILVVRSFVRPKAGQVEVVERFGGT
jgi:type I restriction enzyme R subunit